MVQRLSRLGDSRFIQRGIRCCVSALEIRASGAAAGGRPGRRRCPRRPAEARELCRPACEATGRVRPFWRGGMGGCRRGRRWGGRRQGVAIVDAFSAHGCFLIFRGRQSGRLEPSSVASGYLLPTVPKPRREIPCGTRNRSSRHETAVFNLCTCLPSNPLPPDRWRTTKFDPREVRTVVAFVDHLVGDDQVMPGVHRRLDVISN